MHYANIVKDLIKPRRLEFEKLTQTYGKFVVEPLERGYGTTVGNGLRRILLSSLPGAAPVAVRISGVKHEFSTVPGCVEDVTEMILNLKQLIVRLHERDSATLRLEVRGPKEVVAGDIVGDTFVEIVNPDLHICTLNDDSVLSMEIDVKVGRGYVPTDMIEDDEEVTLGTIAIDALFSPIRKVNHFVTNARLGQRTDYDRLTVEVWTDGSLDPESAIKAASYILREQFSFFCGAEEPVGVVVEQKEEVKPKWNENLFRRIDELELSVRSSNCLENANIKYIGELVRKSEYEMLRTKNFGRKSLNEIKEILSEMGLGLAMKLEGFLERDELDRMYEQSGGNSFS
jgi:DNA-directed RNA polymerase subunit alpha